MGSYEPPKEFDDCTRKPRDCDEVDVISKHPRDFLLDGKPQYYEDLNKKGSEPMPYDEVMDKWKSGTLKSGGSGKPVKNQKQAVAIMLSEKRKAAAGNKEYQSKKVAK